MQVTLLERHSTLGFEASGNPCAMLYPRISGDDSLSEFALAGYLYSLNLFTALHLNANTFNRCGMLQLGFNAREMARIKKVATYYANNNVVHYISQQEASHLAGVIVQHDALYFPDAGWIKPSYLLPHLSQHDNITIQALTNIKALSFINHVWRVADTDNNTHEAEIVVIAKANEAKNFKQSAHIQTQAIHGQISLLGATTLSKNLNCIVCSNGYLSPSIDGRHSLGATDATANIPLAINAQDHLKNFHTLKMISEQLHQDLVPRELVQQLEQPAYITPGRVSSRCTTSDYFPLVGQLLNVETLRCQPPRPNADTNALPWLSGLYINAAHGSKGFTSAPLCAELLASLICNETLPISATLVGLLNPNRFILRAMGLKRLAKTMAISS